MKEVVLGLLGLGNIGGGVWDLVREFGGEVEKRTGVKLRIKKALVLDVKIHGGKEVPDEVLTTDKNDILEDPEIQIVCEFLGGEQPAASMMLRALENGKSVVTANKMALSLHFDELRAMAGKTGAGLYYEASVGGAIPIINAIQSPLIANHIEQMMGIVNGTTNYILTRMTAEGAEYEDVLKDAQRLGLAEPDPTADVEGYDAAYKLSIAGSLAFHSRVKVENVYREGITKVSAEDIAFGRGAEAAGHRQGQRGQHRGAGASGLPAGGPSAGAGGRIAERGVPVRPQLQGYDAGRPGRGRRADSQRHRGRYHPGGAERGAPDALPAGGSAARGGRLAQQVLHPDEGQGRPWRAG